MKNYIINILFVILTFLFNLPEGQAQKVKLKNLVNIKGVRSNKLYGYGVVFGLAGTGDSGASIATTQTVSQMLNKIGVKSSPEQLALGNFAAVLATAELPPYAQSGDKVDVRISASGDASSLAGGTLFLTQLKAGDGQTYVVAQGPVVVGQVSGKGASILTVARIPKGGLIEKEYRPPLAKNGKITLSLATADFTSNARISKEINSHFRGFYAKSLNPASIEVEVPPQYMDSLVAFIAELEGLKVQQDRKAVVIMNERTGTVVMGYDVSIGPVSIAHGDLSVQIKSNNNGSKNSSLIELQEATVGGLINSMNELGVKPADLVGILQAIDAAGALRGEIVFI